MKTNSAKIIFLIAVFILTLSPAFASQNVISSIVISKSKDNPQGYELNIDSTQATQYKTNTEQNGNVYFDLKNSVLAKDAGTIYDDVPSIENVSVRQIEKNKVRIYVKGENAKNTEIVFVNSLFEPQKQKRIVINRPIKEYKSTNFEDDLDLENQSEIQDWNDNSFNLSHLIVSTVEGLKDGIGGIATLVLIILALFIISFKKVADKITSEQEPLIGLSSKIDDEDLEDISLQQEIIKASQEEHPYMHKRYQGIKTAGAQDAIKRGIALAQYQKSNKNPYFDQEVLRIKKDFPNNVINTEIPPRMKNANSTPITKENYNPNMMAFKNPYMQKESGPTNMNNPIETPKTYKSENLKFLESVTKIYEQTGRQDLADGLKNSISKAKQTL